MLEGTIFRETGKILTLLKALTKMRQTCQDARGEGNTILGLQMLKFISKVKVLMPVLTH